MDLLGENLRPRTLLRSLSNAGRRRSSRTPPPPSIEERKHTLLLDLPSEVLQNIIVQMRPIDVLILRKTCTTLCAITRERRLWVALALRMVSHYGMPLAPSEREAMSISNLERFATAPARSMRTMMAASLGKTSIWKRHPKLRPAREMTFKGVSIFSSAPQSYINRYRMLLLPGGRYFLVASWEGHIALCRIDDSGPVELAVSLFSERAAPGLERPLEQYALCAYDVVEDGKVVRVATCAMAESFCEPWKFYIYDIELDAQPPTFRLVASTRDLLRLFGPSSNVCLRGSRLAFADHYRTFVWDFARDRRVAWYDGRALGQTDKLRLTRNPGKDLPQERVVDTTMDPVQTEESSVATMLCVYEWPADAEGVLGGIVFPSLTLCLSADQLLHLPQRVPIGTRFVFHVQSRMPDGDHVMHAYELADDLEQTRRSWAHLTVDPTFGADIFASAPSGTVLVNECDVGQVAVERCSEDFMIHTTWADSRGQRLMGATLKMVSPTTSSSWRFDKQSFDPISGRLCAFRGRDHTLAVVDYIV
ncbi:hypothetical protein HDZ31DRAFT_29754 [Schizophyllum fasciatum]